MFRVLADYMGILASSVFWLSFTNLMPTILGTYILDGTERLSKMTLPLPRKVFSSEFGLTVENVDKLYEAQYLLFCPTIKEGEFDIVIDRRSRMPYEEERFLEEGASGKVYAVKVASKHYQMLEANTTELEVRQSCFYISTCG
jgi:hypothetical protein